MQLDVRANQALRPRVLVVAWSSLLPILLGTFAALSIIGPSGIDPTNIGWNEHGDAATHYLGWCFFRNAPWHFPLGSNPDYGMEMGSSIFYSDSIPLLALTFKIFARWLSTPFQYFGIWVWACLVLQALFAWQLLARFAETKGVVLRVCALGLFLFSPPLLIRVGGHSALVGHWLILAALAIYFRGRGDPSRFKWPGLTLLASLVHAYLLCMVLAVWLADWARRTFRKEKRLRDGMLDIVLVLGAAALGLWQAGFFLVPVNTNSGYGDFGMNLLAPFNPDIYSWVLPPVAPPFIGFHEGFNFFGLGVLLLAPMLVLALLRRPARLLSSLRVHWCLAFVLLALTCFAVTDHVAIGTRLLTIPIPSRWISMASVLRSSGRMFWPVYYVTAASCVLFLARAFGERAACVVLALASLAQIADTSRGWWAHLHRHFRGTRAETWATPLTDPFWDQAAREYRVLRRLPIANSAPDYAVLAFYASSHGMATNAAYLARIDAKARDRAEHESDRALDTGSFDADTLYILDPARAARAAEKLDSEADLLARIDGYFVLAPGWQSRAHPGLAILPSVALRDIQPGIKPGQEISFGTGARGVGYLASGWSEPEPWGVWSNATSAELIVPFDPREPRALEFDWDVGAFVSDGHPQEIECSINGVPAANWRFDVQNQSGWRTIRIPTAAREIARSTQELSVRFDIRNPTSPRALGLGDDGRNLGLALRHLKLSVQP